MTGNFDSQMFLAILPEILILVLGAVVLGVDMALPAGRKRVLGWLTAFGLILILFISLGVARPGMEPALLWGGMIRHDWMAFIFKLMFLFSAAITAMLAMDHERLGQRGEFYLLLLASTIGMNAMAAAADLIMLYLAIETTSIPLYVMAGFMTREDKSTEAGFKYLLFGALTSTVMLYGFSLLYGFSGTTSLYSIAQGLQSGALASPALVASLLLVLVGFGFKISAAPLHFWAPDVYEGAPTPVAGFLSTASKAAGFAVLLRFLPVVFSGVVISTGTSLNVQWAPVLTALSVATMTFGNLLALAQTNIKRLLAYSSIAHAGYVLIGVVSIQPLGMTSAIFYLLAYLLTNLAAFGVVAYYGRMVGSDEISAYAGMSRRSPGLALVMLVAFLSLAGMPPLGGFVVKFFVFAAAIQSNLVFLAVIAVLNAIIGLYYYMTVLKVIYLYRQEGDEVPLPVSRPYALALGVLTVGILLVGTLFGPWFQWVSVAAAAF